MRRGNLPVRSQILHSVWRDGAGRLPRPFRPRNDRAYFGLLYGKNCGVRWASLYGGCGIALSVPQDAVLFQKTLPFLGNFHRAKTVEIEGKLCYNFCN